MKVLIKRGGKDGGELKACQRIFTLTGIFQVSPKRLRKHFCLMSFFFYFSHARIKIKQIEGNSSSTWMETDENWDADQPACQTVP